ncbi:MAG: Flagellar motor switch protein FliN [Bacteroidetes bacterium]|nr:Flagellar motor switch protein FliN [Bacteroidota bacterium]
MDLTLPVAIELGRTQMLIRDILDLQRGSVVEFEKLASEPVDILINGKKMAEGEVVVIEKHFGIRITSLVDTEERVKGLGR